MSRYCLNSIAAPSCCYQICWCSCNGRSLWKSNNFFKKIILLMCLDSEVRNFSSPSSTILGTHGSIWSSFITENYFFNQDHLQVAKHTSNILLYTVDFNVSINFCLKGWNLLILRFCTTDRHVISSTHLQRVIHIC